MCDLRKIRTKLFVYSKYRVSEKLLFFQVAKFQVYHMGHYWWMSRHFL